MLLTRKIFTSFFISCFLSASMSIPAQASEWQFEVTPYLWALNMNGHTNVGPLSAPIDQSFSDIFKHLNFAAMIYGSAHKDAFGLYGNVLYAKTTVNDNFDSDRIRVRVTNSFGVYGAGASYIVYSQTFSNQQLLQLEPYAGARYTINNTSLKINNLRGSLNEHWTDPVVGLQVRYHFNNRWSLFLAGDVGGTSTATDASYSATALLGYSPATMWTNTTTYLGYRLLSQHYQTGSGLGFYNWNVRLYGPVIGITIKF
jgi:hypothetical protein